MVVPLVSLCFNGLPSSSLYYIYLIYFTTITNCKINNKTDKCPFCRITKLSDEEALIVFRGKEAYVVMNLYPYNAGHLLICTNRHVAELPDLTVSERNEVQEITAHAMKVLRKVSNAIGFNIGINQGAVSGAGIAGHLHQHVVPRWGGDANFMPIIGKTKVLPKLLQESRDQLAAAWNQI